MFPGSVKRIVDHGYIRQAELLADAEHLRRCQAASGEPESSFPSPRAIVNPAARRGSISRRFIGAALLRRLPRPVGVVRS